MAQDSRYRGGVAWLIVHSSLLFACAWIQQAAHWVQRALQKHFYLTQMRRHDGTWVWALPYYWCLACYRHMYKQRCHKYASRSHTAQLTPWAVGYEYRGGAGQQCYKHAGRTYSVSLSYTCAHAYGSSSAQLTADRRVAMAHASAVSYKR